MKWNNDLSVGNVTVDSQHKKLFEIVESLMDACNNHKGKDEVERTLIFLEQYTKTHFKDEEKLMLDYRYPNYKEHKNIHDKFSNEVSSSVEKFKSGGANILILMNVLSITNNWLLDHIMKMDKDYAKFFKDKK